MPLPQTSFERQLLLQPSPLFVLPSSQTSFGSLTLLPHDSLRQIGDQPSPSITLPSSHSSAGSTRPLPHAVVRQIGWTAPQYMVSGHRMPVPGHSFDFG